MTITRCLTFNHIHNSAPNSGGAKSEMSCIDFGTVQVGQLVTKYIHVKNLTSIDNVLVDMDVDVFRTLSDSAILAARHSTLDPQVVRAAAANPTAALFSSSLCLSDKKNGLGVGIEHKQLALDAEQTRTVAVVLMPQASVSTSAGCY
jgi:hypothetical protein